VKGLRGICLGLWGGLLLFSYSSKRLNLLVRAPLQPLIGLAGVVLLLLAGLDIGLAQGRQGQLAELLGVGAVVAAEQGAHPLAVEASRAGGSPWAGIRA
jgi:hypothetical protein